MVLSANTVPSLLLPPSVVVPDKVPFTASMLAQGTAPSGPLKLWIMLWLRTCRQSIRARARNDPQTAMIAGAGNGADAGRRALSPSQAQGRSPRKPKTVLMRSLFGAFRVLGMVVAIATSIAPAGAGEPHKIILAVPVRFAYDQIEITLYFLPSEKTVDSPPGSFERDYRWAATQTGDNDHKYATLHHIAYFDGWTRVETAQSIQLENRQRRIVIIADKATATFRRYTGARAEAMLATDRRSQYGTVAAAAINVVPGSAVYEVRDHHSPLPAVPLGGVMAMGQQTVESTVADDTKGSCAAGRLSLVGYHAISVITEYRAPFAEPGDPPFHLQKTDDRIVDMCHVRVVRASEPAAARRFADRFLLYRREEDRAVLHDGAKVRSVDITERGHVRALDESDHGILSLPQQYVDACSRRPVPDDCEPLATYARLNANLVLTRAGGGFGRVIQSRDGSIWFSENAADRLGRIGKDNVVHEIALPAGTMPVNLAETPDGTIWFTEGGFAVVGGRHSGIGSYAPNGTISEPVRFKKGEFIGGVTAANDGSVWFSYGQENGTVSEATRSGAVKSVARSSGKPAYRASNRPGWKCLGCGVRHWKHRELDAVRSRYPILAPHEWRWIRLGLRSAKVGCGLHRPPTSDTSTWIINFRRSLCRAMTAPRMKS